MSRCGIARRWQPQNGKWPERILSLVANRRVRVTARSRRNEHSAEEAFSSALRWQHPLEIKDTNRHRSRSSTQECEWKQGESAVAKGTGEMERRANPQTSLRQQGRKTGLPLSRFPAGESRGGRVPPRRQKTAAPPARGQAPLRHPPKRTIVDFVVDRGRPSHGSRDRKGACMGALP